MNQHHHHLQEHCGCVRGLGLGPCPSKVFGSKGHSYSGASSSYPSNSFGSQEHCGRVRGLGLGPCPSKVFGSKGHSYSRASSSYPSNAQLQNQVSTLTSQLNEMKAMVNFLVQNYQGELPRI
ncbi:hypothetical protein DEO72_LG6g89 [Vigna unguiculata]|uniref:Uncharacterized protein n=1 Tax=Vigna unguiculata TaxID=3917 RepID=A0A4D6M3H1_VIGUN|nr:hypothetical protein DEO72_LG6g89 [Vigna unguiculata]